MAKGNYYPIQAPTGGGLSYSGGEPSLSPSVASYTPIQTQQRQTSYPTTYGSGATGAGTAIGTVIAPGIGTAIGAGAGALIDLGITLWGQSKADKQAAADKKAAEQWARIQNEIARKESARQWKWLEEERDYKYAMDFNNNLWSMMNQDVSLKNNLVNLWRATA